MTAQAMETIYIDGKRNYMASEPFNSYLESLETPPILFSPNTACWRGYYGRWKIKDNKLYITGLEAYLDAEGKTEEVGLSFFFPDQKQVFAEWFSGELCVVVGKLVNYVHAGYGSTYEKDLIIQIEKGVVKSRNEIINA